MKKIYITHFLLYIFSIIIILTLINRNESYANKALMFFIGTTTILVFSFIYSVRRLLILEWEKRCKFLDDVISKRNQAKYELSKETLFSKEQRKIKELVRILNNERILYEKEKLSIQALVTDISHQIKTPLANISMYTSTLLERNLERERQIEFLTYSNSQIIKLQWLIESLIKISRLETEIISLNKGNYKVEDTLASAIGGVYGMAIDKHIRIDVNCDPKIRCTHDMKWTAEALFNILENAIKYTKIHGDIKIDVVRWESFTRINIEDTGVGINQDEINNIFKRFYRGSNVSQREGAGIGLFLAREIIQRQGGYITVKSILNKGSTFSVFLYNG